MKILLDMLAPVAFLVAYWLGDIYTATMALMAALFLVVALYWLIERRLHRLHLAAAVAAGVLGSITLYVHDPLFIKLKPTLVYGLISLALLGSHVIGSKVLLARIPQKVLNLPDHVWWRLNLAWGCFFAFCSALNYYVVMHLDESVWVQLKAYGFTVLTLSFTALLLPFIYKYLPREEAPAGKS